MHKAVRTKAFFDSNLPTDRELLPKPSITGEAAEAEAEAESSIEDTPEVRHIPKYPGDRVAQDLIERLWDKYDESDGE